MTRRHLEVTGIGAIACARHGCFVPHSVVDFQKGEQSVKQKALGSQILANCTILNSDKGTLTMQYAMHLHTTVAQQVLGCQKVFSFMMWHASIV